MYTYKIEYKSVIIPIIAYTSTSYLLLFTCLYALSRLPKIAHIENLSIDLLHLPVEVHTLAGYIQYSLSNILSLLFRCTISSYRCRLALAMIAFAGR